MPLSHEPLVKTGVLRSKYVERHVGTYPPPSEPADVCIYSVCVRVAVFLFLSRISCLAPPKEKKNLNKSSNSRYKNFQCALIGNCSVAKTGHRLHLSSWAVTNSFRYPSGNDFYSHLLDFMLKYNLFRKWNSSWLSLGWSFFRVCIFQLFPTQKNSA